MPGMPGSVSKLRRPSPGEEEEGLSVSVEGSLGDLQNIDSVRHTKAAICVVSRASPSHWNGRARSVRCIWPAAN